MGKGDFRYFGQEVDVNAINLVKHKGFCHYEYMPDFENVKQQLSSKEKFYSSLAGEKIIDKENEHDLKVWNKFETKTMKDYHNLYCLIASALRWHASLIWQKLSSDLCRTLRYIYSFGKV